MRCPKCHYISFDSGERCRNCGYDFSLAIDLPETDFALSEEPEGPLTDFSLNQLDEPGAEKQRASSDSSVPGEASADEPSAPPPATGTAGLELPLFQTGDGQPLVTPLLTPRPPLAVRRATPTVARVREQPAEPPPRLQLEAEAEDARPTPAPPSAPAPASVAVSVAGPSVADTGRRATAALIDLAIVGGIDLAVLHFTLQLSDLRWAELGLLPWIPFAAFLLMLDGGYAVAFTAAVGQTIGKMAAGIRVESAGPGDGRPSPGQAVARAASYLVSVVPLGLGFLTAFVSDDRRALHDRLSGTRVVNVH